MSKNIFEEKSKIPNIFEALNYNTKNLLANELEVNSQKSAKKSFELNLKELPNKSNDQIKEVHETPSKNKKQVTINEPESSSNSSPPAMYKIAMRIKKLTEVKTKKNINIETQNVNSLVSDNREGIVEESKTNDSKKENKSLTLSNQEDEEELGSNFFGE